MGFGEVASQTIFFIAILGISITLVAIFNNYIATTSASMEYNRQRMIDNLNTHFKIMNVFYDNTTNQTKLYVLNDGQKKLKLDQIDVYIDNRFVSRDIITKTIESSTDVRDPGIWNPEETLYIEINLTLNNGTHAVDVASTTGFKASELFSVG